MGSEMCIRDRVESVSTEVEEGRFDEELEKLLKSRAEMVEIEPSKAGGDDQFIGSYELIEEDRVLKSVDQAGFLPASGNLEAFAIEELEKVVEDWDRSKAGTNDGAPLEIEVTVPAHYPDEVLRGREVLLRFVLEKTRPPSCPSSTTTSPRAWAPRALMTSRRRSRSSSRARSKETTRWSSRRRLLRRL